LTKNKDVFSGIFKHSSQITLMIATLIFSAISAGLVFLVGRRDVARDPRLTVMALVLCGLFPALVSVLPKFSVFPARIGTEEAVGLPWQAILLSVWGFVVLLGFARLGFASRRIAEWRRSSKVLLLIDGIEIRQLAGLRSPVAAGAFRPVVFVPNDWEAWPEHTRQIILNHELAHHHRRDPLWRWIAEIACVVNAYNPAVTWMARRLTAQCEFACDEQVLEKGVTARDYAKVLCDFAESGNTRGLVLAMAEASSLEGRVRRLLVKNPPLSLLALLSGIGAAVVCAGALSTMGAAVIEVPGISQEEIDLRWSANPFPN
jgi:BlaR1 peptidase M56